MDNIMFTLTKEQAEQIANHWGMELNENDEYSICELLDDVIDNLKDNRR